MCLARTSPADPGLLPEAWQGARVTPGGRSGDSGWGGQEEEAGPASPRRVRPAPRALRTHWREQAARRWLPHSPWQGQASAASRTPARSEEHTSELQSQFQLVCRLLLEQKTPFLLL